MDADTTVDIAILGAGFSGLGMAARLLMRGQRDFVVLEKAGEVGGTWRENTYPGCACDVPSHLYSFSFAPHPGWSRMFARQPEIQAYLVSVANRFAIRPHCRFGFEVRDLAWDDAARRWRIEAGDGRVVSARVVVSGMGGLHIPAWPEIAGLETFRGPVFHSARWRHDVPLEGRRVAVIGTGASAIQFVPQIQPKVAALDLHQRTPPWIMAKGDREMSGLEQALFRLAPPVQALYRGTIYSLNELRGLGFLDPRLMEKAEVLARDHLAAQVADPVLRARLTPDYTIGCKRVLISNDYYPALTRPNVTLCDSGIERINATGIVGRDGVERPADVVILATGFKPMDVMASARFTGQGGRTLHEDWARGPEAHLGITVPGYPNLFLLMGPNTGLGHNSMVYMIESQIAYVLDALDTMAAEGRAALVVSEAAARASNEALAQKMTTTVWASGCRSWYVQDDGKNPTIWPDLTFRYRARTRKLDRDSYEPV